MSDASLSDLYTPAMKSVISRVACRHGAANKAPITACRQPLQSYSQPRRAFHESRNWKAVKPYLLADIGEGITECQVIQWFVKPGARVEQFDPICEVQSDKASVEITSRFDGVIKRLYYEPDDMAKVGKPLVDIDIQSDISEADAALLNGGSEKEASASSTETTGQQVDGLEVGRNDTNAVTGDVPPPAAELLTSAPQRTPGKHATLAVPAVRHLIKEFGLNVEDIEGTGKDGRVTKEDVHRHAEGAKQPTKTTPSAPTSTPAPIPQAEDQVKPLTPVQSGMFKQMTRSLSIPHFVYTDGVDFSALNSLRKKYNVGKDKSGRLSALPFVIKAVSLSLLKFPLLNAHLDTTTNPDKPQMVVKGSHNIGVAVDSPAGLLVPVIKNVQSHTIESLAAEVSRLSKLAREGKLTSADLTGATFTLSNIGSIGGGAVSPVISTPQVAILGVGKAKLVPAFGENGEIIKREECVFSWSADHRVIDGAMAARCAESVREYLENVESMLVRLR
ncbi:hypothetical protein BU24DRAFT_489002 [Aaosphaeria arxii CBS 175.79]|uniref:Dihydrolipoamide acetyltransferase component of pyruvate dehydrogenase complex n=1 Tax=Aaosphaeria arxii CBS 175.79 TaxID=1450172 RepID=A0A6A5Y129_9PLEO|nr:uncharacterized protein BU24DRAFT_489002 [Aaosphaeria arxii CBS 175.79]KAF2018946.1 hypothetical protein BU24DRAFT_489002 [Aaosphaeria arxii CBS 175.79]